MSDDAIHDILEQTESDPAFQALFDLFDYSKHLSLPLLQIYKLIQMYRYLYLFHSFVCFADKGKGLDTEDMSTSLEDNNATGTAPDTRPLMTEVNPGIKCYDI